MLNVMSDDSGLRPGRYVQYVGRSVIVWNFAYKMYAIPVFVNILVGKIPQFFLVCRDKQGRKF
jgi:hypothetical protein